MIQVKCLCIDDSNKPKEIPKSKWVVKDKEYTITHIFFHYQQQISGVELKEITLDDSYFPFISFMITRFAFTKESLEQLANLAKECSELTDVDISKLLEPIVELETK